MGGDAGTTRGNFSTAKLTASTGRNELNTGGDQNTGKNEERGKLDMAIKMRHQVVQAVHSGDESNVEEEAAAIGTLDGATGQGPRDTNDGNLKLVVVVV